MLLTDIKTILLAVICFAAGMTIQSIFQTTEDDILTSYEGERRKSNCNSEDVIVPTTMQNSTAPAVPTVKQTHLSLLDEIIPPALHTNYTPDNLQFNITRSMLKRSRPIIGNTERLHAFIQKLRSKQCTVVLFLGGSVTDGHHVKGRAAEAYPAHFIIWLNARYPCLESDGSAGKHIMKKTHAQNSQTHFVHWSTVSEIDRIDLVLIEFNANDSFIADLPHALEDKGEDGKTRPYADLWYSEVLLRRLLLLRKPDPLAIITFNADYVGAAWAPTPYSDPTEDRKRLFRRNEEPMKLWISSLYEIPVVSASIWMLPLASKMGISWQFNRTHNPYSTSSWHADKCCHPRKEGHRILVMILAYNIVREEQDMSLSTDTLADVEKDMTLHGVLRDPIYLSPEEEALYVLNDAKEAFSIDFTDPKGWDVWNEKLISNDGGWRWEADNVDEDKFGLIANAMNGGVHVSIEIVGGKFGILEIQFVVSYENFGISYAWVDSNEGNTKQLACNTAIRGKIPVDTNMNGLQRLIAVWNEPASVPRVQLMHTGITQGQKQFFHVCLTPKSKHTKGEENKFKLLGIRAY